MFGLHPANRIYDTKQPSALGSYRPLHLQVNSVETEGGHINSPGHPGPEDQTFPLWQTQTISAIFLLCPTCPHSPALLFSYSFRDQGWIQALPKAEHKLY